jgi:hypothetical protein
MDPAIRLPPEQFRSRVLILNAEGYTPPLLGDVETIKDKMTQYLPDIEWSRDNPSIGYVVDQACLIEFNISPDYKGMVHSIGVHPNGIAEVEAIIQKLCISNEWYVFDPQSGEWIHPTRLGQWGTASRSSAA